ncbi:MAG: cupin domain-containing protein [Scrofimicrobium sp.]
MKVRVVGFEDVPGAAGVSMAMILDQTQLERIRVDAAVLEYGSSLPKHRAGQHQLFFVVSGTGRVAGADDIEVPVRPGSLVEWQPGEEHTSFADSRMTVLIIQERSVEIASGVPSD